jgi:hypothetical protein
MSLWMSDDVEKIAQALILSNSDPNFRAGVAALAHALGARNVRVTPGMPTIAQIVSGRREVER